MVVHLAAYLHGTRLQVGVCSLFGSPHPSLERLLEDAHIPTWYLGKRLGFDVRMFPRLSRVVSTYRPHVVHTHRYVIRYLLPILLRRRVRAWVHTVHNVANKEVDRVGVFVQRLAFRLGVVPVAVAEQVAVSVTNTYGVTPVVIPNGIPLSVYAGPRVCRDRWRAEAGLSPDKVAFVCVARLSPQKNHALLLEAFTCGPAIDDRACLLLAGDGPLRSQLEKRACELGLLGKVHFLGLRDDLPEVLAASDVFVLSSDWEGLPLSVMEAMAAGKPVISTAVGGVPQLVKHGETGLLTPPGNVRAFADAMITLLREPAQRESMGRAGAAQAAQHFGVEQMASAYADLYELLLAKRAHVR